jgi:glycerol-3-phosphate dehydrogenase
LYDDKSENASSVTRDYILAYDDEDGAPILSIFGGKITTYRKLAEDAITLMEKAFGKLSETWTETKPLPGGDIAAADFEAFFETLKNRFHWLDTSTLYRLARCYGSKIDTIIGDASSEQDLGFHYGHGLYQNEVDYLLTNEFAKTANDILQRRTKLGLYLSPEQKTVLEQALEQKLVA